MDLYVILIIGHLIGTILGVGGATFIEIHLNMALRDGKMEALERAYMGWDFLMTRIGLGIAFITGLGFIAIYWQKNQLFRLEDGVFWAKMAIIGIIIINAYLLHKHKVGLYWGSAFSFVSWWSAMILGTFLTNGVRIFPQNDFLSFASIMFVYGGMIIIGAALLHKIRQACALPKPTESTTVSQNQPSNKS